MVEKYNLNWETFSEHLQLMFKDLYEEEKHSDVTLVCDDQTQFKAHKIVLRACSPVFKKIIDNNPSQHPLIYLRGIQSYEMESILQFMYLGETKCCYERMGEFINVANSLEVKEICRQKIEITTENQVIPEENEKHFDSKEKEKMTDENSKMEYQQMNLDNEKTSDTEEKGMQQMTRISKKNLERFSDENNDESFVHFKAERKLEVFEKEKNKDRTSTENNPNTFQCSDCGNFYKNRANLQRHFKDKHQGFRVLCDQCDYQTGDPNNLSRHRAAIHEEVRYRCDQCEYQATAKHHLITHVRNVHEKVKHPCSQCDFKASSRPGLNRHVKNIHEGIKHPCKHCEYQATQQSNLVLHMKNKHSEIHLRQQRHRIARGYHY